MIERKKLRNDKWEQQLEDERHFDMWRTTGTWVWVVEGKLEAELLVAEKKLEMEKAALTKPITW